MISRRPVKLFSILYLAMDLLRYILGYNSGSKFQWKLRNICLELFTAIFIGCLPRYLTEYAIQRISSSAFSKVNLFYGVSSVTVITSQTQRSLWVATARFTTTAPRTRRNTVSGRSAIIVNFYALRLSRSSLTENETLREVVETTATSATHYRTIYVT